ncbi:MAG: response regulator transcription factor [Nitrospira sp.]|nr:response regulator transcription factor [Nitrospira sp.]
MPVTLLIAEDQRLFRQSLRLLLERERDLRVVGEATDGREAFEQAMKLRPEMILMDVDMPRLDGVTATRLIRGCLPDTNVLMLSVHDEDARIVAAVQAGACGYILKDADHAEFLRIIRATHRGEHLHLPFMPDRFAHRAVSALQGSGTPPPGLVHLTEREREILAHAASGQGNKEIADRLGLSLDTVKTHLHHIYQKLHVTGRVEAILSYLRAC